MAIQICAPRPREAWRIFQELLLDGVIVARNHHFATRTKVEGVFVGPRRTHDAKPALVASPESQGENEIRTREVFGKEQLLLGSIIKDNGILNEAIKRGLASESFFNHNHKRLFATMLALNRQGKPIGEPTIHDELISTFGDSCEVDALAAYASSLTMGIPDYKLREHANHAVGRIKNEWALRKGAGWCNSFIKILDRQSVDAHALIEAGERIFQSIAHELKIGEATEEPSLGLADMPLSVLDGRLGEICQRRLLASGLPLAYAWPAVVTVAGGLVPPSSGIRTNLFTALVGPIGTAKSEAVKRSLITMGVEPPIHQKLNPGSSEGLLENIGNADGAARIVNVDELRHLMEKAKIDGASFPYILNRSFYESQFELMIARGKRVPVNCRLSFIGGVVKLDFQECFGGATTGGLYDRFLFGNCPQPFEFLYRPFEGGAEATDPCAVEIACDVWDERDEWVRTIPNLTPRLAELALRVAMIAASFAGRGVLRAKNLAPAREFAAYQARIRLLLAPNPGENPDARCAHKILRALPESGAQVEERIISKQIHSEKFGPGVFRHAVDHLRANKEIEWSHVGHQNYLRKII